MSDERRIELASIRARLTEFWPDGGHSVAPTDDEMALAAWGNLAFDRPHITLEDVKAVLRKQGESGDER